MAVKLAEREGGWATSQVTVRVVRNRKSNGDIGSDLSHTALNQLSPKDMIFHDFDIDIGKGPDSYRVHVINSPVGGTSFSFRLSFTEAEWNHTVKIFSISQLSKYFIDFHSEIKATNDLPEQETDPFSAQDFGKRLFQSLFQSVTGAALKRSLDYVSTKNQGLRIRLMLDGAPELYALPWELLCDPETEQFLALTPNVTLSRCSNRSIRTRGVVASPIRMLVVASQPEDVAPIDIGREIDSIQSIFEPLVTTGKMIIELCRDVSLDQLTEIVAEKTFHIFHFIGHADHDELSGGALLINDNSGKAVKLSLNQLNAILAQNANLQLVVLNTEFLGAYAFGMVKERGSYPVIAHQFRMTDDSCIIFAESFYRELASGSELDLAVANARKELFNLQKSNMPLEEDLLPWASVVLHTRLPNDILYQFFNR